VGDSVVQASRYCENHGWLPWLHLTFIIELHPHPDHFIVRPGPHPSILKLEAAISSKMLGSAYKARQHQDTEDHSVMEERDCCSCAFNARGVFSKEGSTCHEN
jgi:hypothetical protein